MTLWLILDWFAKSFDKAYIFKREKYNFVLLRKKFLNEVSI